jgi:hypothetical protein
MRQRRWKWWLIGGALALWLGPAILTAPGDSIRVAIATDRSDWWVALPRKRISAAGVHYGRCAGPILTVVLDPEPCDWERLRRDRNVASR